MSDRPHFDTRAVHAGAPAGEASVQSRACRPALTPIHRSTVYGFPAGLGADADAPPVVYPRLSNLPNQLRLAEALANLESAEAGLVTASGMAAISTLMFSLLRPGDHLLAHAALYGGTHGLITGELASWGVSHTFVDTTDPSAWRAALRPNTKLLFTESLTNPMLEVPAHREVVAFCREHGLVSVIDSTFATPVVFRPFELGYDVVIHSATKYLNGHSDVVAGAILSSRDTLARVKPHLDHFGGMLDPQAAYLLHRGLKTLALRVRRQNENAMVLALTLSRHEAVKRVNYPGLPEDPHHDRARDAFAGAHFGAMLSLELTGGVPAAVAMCERLRLFLHAPSLGGVESLVTRPVTASHRTMPKARREALGVSEGLIRLSVGIEDPADLVADVEAALATG